MCILLQLKRFSVKNNWFTSKEIQNRYISSKMLGSLPNPIFGCSASSTLVLSRMCLGVLPLGSGHMRWQETTPWDLSSEHSRPWVFKKWPTVHGIWQFASLLGHQFDYVRLVRWTHRHAACDQTWSTAQHPPSVWICNILFIAVCAVTLIKGLRGSLVNSVGLYALLH